MKRTYRTCENLGEIGVLASAQFAITCARPSLWTHSQHLIEFVRIGLHYMYLSDVACVCGMAGVFNLAIIYVGARICWQKQLRLLIVVMLVGFYMPCTPICLRFRSSQLHGGSYSTFLNM